ncbi:hypothetical protein [Streptomyces ipomoeae]|nr:hypothetical protein [Streptomyces ipomoeae]MDX2937474.1 hypothetical protein [Streptomyces ipomoeae]
MGVGPASRDIARGSWGLEYGGPLLIGIGIGNQYLFGARNA